MDEIPAYRLNLLRAAYLLFVVGLGLVIWPSVLNPSTIWELQRGVVVAMLAALSILSLIGLRHPLRMLPLLFWEVAWKTIWLLRVALPSWAGDRLDVATTRTVWDCVTVIIVITVIPWDHVYRVYVRGPSEPWRKRT